MAAHELFLLEGIRQLPTNVHVVDLSARQCRDCLSCRFQQHGCQNAGRQGTSLLCCRGSGSHKCMRMLFLLSLQVSLSHSALTMMQDCRSCMYLNLLDPLEHNLLVHDRWGICTSIVMYTRLWEPPPPPPPPPPTLPPGAAFSSLAAFMTRSLAVASHEC